MNYLGEYTEVGWENEPSQKTPINAKNLGIMEDAIKRIFNYLIAGGAPVVPENPEISGKDGREIELRNNGAFIQWRYAGDENWSDLVSLEELKGDEGAGIKSIKYIDSNGLVDTYAITLTNGMETTFSVTNGKNGTDANVTSENIKMALGYTPADAEKVSELSGQIADLKQNGTGLTDAEKNLILTLFQNAVFTTDQSANIQALYNLFFSPSEEIEVTGITLSHTDLTFEDMNSRNLTATLSPNGATGVITWASTNENVAKVSQLGAVTPVSNGNCVITASIKDYSASCNITVNVSVIINITQEGSALTIIDAPNVTQDGSVLTIS